MDTDNRRQALFGQKVKELRATCKNNKYRGYSKLRKKELVEHIISWEQKDRKSKKDTNHMSEEIKRLSEEINRLTTENLSLQEVRGPVQEEVQEMKDCSICLDSHEEQCTVKMKCCHSLCFDCFVRHARTSNTCPLCRAEFAAPPKQGYKQGYEQGRSRGWSLGWNRGWESGWSVGRGGRDR